MKKKNTVLIFGITSILVLISVQVYIIKGIWQQKDQLFAISYTIHSREGVYAITSGTATDGFDTVRMILDHYASTKAIEELHSAKNADQIVTVKKDILDYFTKVG